MKIGAQMFSLNGTMDTLEDVRSTLGKIKEMGYQNIQASGSAMIAIDPYALRDFTQEFGLDIVITHQNPERLLLNIKNIIEFHKVCNIPVVGIGSMPPKWRDGTIATTKRFMGLFDDVAKRLQDEGFRFAYHNHDFEFKALDNGRCIFDHLVEDVNWDIIADVCWIHYAGRSVPETLGRIKGRIENAHLKDIREPLDQKDFCPLGEGVVNLPEAYEALKANGCVNALVEQDNASKKPDPLDEMRRSIEYCKKQNWC